MRVLAGFLVVAANLLLASPSHGNDAMARVGAGGIVLVKSECVRMLEEVLEISTSRISVKYRFYNDSTEDIRTMVAFPMPPYQWTSGHAMWDRNQKPVSTFQAFVNGHPVETRTITRALIGRVDVTGKLRRAGLTERQIRTFAGSRVSEDGERLVDDLTRTQKRAVKKLGRADEPGPPWTVASTIVWKQAFPAGKEVVVEHGYVPFVGTAYTVPYREGHRRSDFPVYPTAAGVPEGTDEVCLDAATQKSIDDRIDALKTGGPDEVQVSLRDVEYVLGTGRNWKGPIGTFTLRIKKDSPDQMVSLCFPGQRREVGSGVYEFTKKDFVPQDRLVVYFYDVGVNPEIGRREGAREQVRCVPCRRSPGWVTPGTAPSKVTRPGAE
jgi:hypothetical protein